MIASIRRSPLALWLTAAVSLALAAFPLSAGAEAITVKLCSADGQVRSLTIPLQPGDGDDSCAKPCHACLNRKKPQKNR
ncbi:hypothetical protein [Parasphingorhabdus sp.]|uniref:hypothetical protein n=1 Tax=Parasphingorhabdus sp. TaxID=2709688 RepID=UPI003002FCCA